MVLAFLKSLFGGRKSKRRKRKAQRVGGGFVPTSQGSGTAGFLLAEIAGAGGDQVTARIEDLLTQESSLGVFRRKQSLEIKIGADESLAGVQKVSEQGTEWLTEDQADLLIWGQMLDLGTAVALRFLPAASDGQASVFGPGDKLMLPVPTPRAMDDLIFVSALGALLPVHKGARKTLAKLIEERMPALKALWKDAPHLEAPHLASALTCYGNVCTALANAGLKKYRDEAIQAYQRAAREVGKDEDILVWAVAEHHFAAALQVKGQADSDPAALDAAAEAYRQIGRSLPRDRFPNEWALANIALAMVLYRLGNQDTSLDRLKESAEAFDSALEVFSKDAWPGKWAESKTQYGTVLLAIGERMQGEQVLEKACEAFQDALDVRQKEIVPLLWAQTSNNLGAACFALAKRAFTPELITRAEESFEGAAEIYEMAGQQKRVLTIRKNLERVRQLSAKKTGG